MKAFSFLAPQGVDEAVTMLDRHGDEARPMAGGQSLLLAMKERTARPSYLVSLAGLPELRGCSYRPDGALVVGAATTYTTVQHAELTGWHREIGAVAGNLADRPVRNMGTIGGALCQAEPRFDMPALAVGCDATVRTVSTAGERTRPATDLFAAAGGSALTPGELLTTVTFSPRFTGVAFEKFRYRVFDAALASVVCAVTVTGTTVTEARLAVGAVTPVPVLVTADRLLGAVPGPADIAGIAHGVACEVLPDPDTPARRYQRELVEVLARRAIGRAVEGS